MVHAGEAIPYELLRDVRDTVAIALGALLGRIRRTSADAIDGAARAIGHAAVERAALIVIEGAAGRIRRLGRDAGELERLAVVEGRVAATVMYDDGMVLRDLIKVVRIERALVLELRVVVEVALDPRARRQLLRFGAELLDCLLYTSDAADERSSVDLGGRRIIKKKKK